MTEKNSKKKSLFELMSEDVSNGLGGGMVIFLGIVLMFLVCWAIYWWFDLLY